MKKSYPELDIKLTDFAINWITQFGSPIIAKDFVGYKVYIDEDTAIAVSLDNKIVPFSLNSKKPLTKRKIKKLFKLLASTKFIRNAIYDPFPDFEKYSNIPFEVNEAVNTGGYAFKKSFEAQDDNFIPDDDCNISDISDAMEKLNIKIDEKN